MIALVLLLLGNSSFVVDASSEAQYTVNVSRTDLRNYVDDIGLFARNMPGVVGIESLGDQMYLYHTRKSIPLSSPMETTFRIKRIVESDSVTHYRSLSADDENYMSCTVLVRAVGPESTSIAIALRIRLARASPSDVHWLAPIFGAEFISQRMTEDLGDMLEQFIENSSAELQERHLAATPGVSNGR